MMEYLFDTTRAVVNLVFSGAIERFPRIRFVLPHAGGVVPYFAWRLSVSPMIDTRLPQTLARGGLRTAAAFLVRQRALADRRDASTASRRSRCRSEIVFGSDWPFANARVIAEAVRDLRRRSDAAATQREAIDRDNALSLFPQFA